MQNDTFLVTPMSKRISLEAGEVYTGTIKVANPANSTSDFSFTASVSPYGVAGEDYTADIAALIMKADKFKADIDATKKQINALRKVVVCDGCGKEISEEAFYCSFCGTKQIKPEPVVEEETAEEAEEEISVEIVEEAAEEAVEEAAEETEEAKDAE